MRYRTKLTLVLVGLVLAGNGMLFALMYLHARDVITEQLHSKVTSIAAGTAAVIDAEAHRGLRSRADEETDAYRQLVQTLRRVRDANRRDDVHIKFIYTLTRSEQDPSVVLFGVDAEESLKEKSHVGDVYRDGTDRGLAARCTECRRSPPSSPTTGARG
jgi:hypothetical protein